MKKIKLDNELIATAVAVIALNINKYSFFRPFETKKRKKIVEYYSKFLYTNAKP